jgi:hypothetical protein
MSGGWGGGASAGKAGAAWWLGFDTGGNATFSLDLPDGWENLLVQMIGTPATVPDLNSPPRIYAPFLDGVKMKLITTVGPYMAAFWYGSGTGPFNTPKPAGTHSMTLKHSDDGGATWVDADTDTSGSCSFVMFATVGHVIYQPGS